MPSIEIISVGQKECTRFTNLTLALESEKKIESHRSKPLFENDFNILTGCIYHIGCPHLRIKESGLFEAYDLLSRNCQRQEDTVFLEFKRKYLLEIKRILKTLLKNSPGAKIIFTSDYQFSNNKPKRIKGLSLVQFWELHKNKSLLFNTLYEINDFK